MNMRKHIQKNTESALKPVATMHSPILDDDVSGEPYACHDFGQIQIHASAPETLQTKLVINQPGDSYEQEAERMAKQVTKMETTTPSEVPSLSENIGLETGDPLTHKEAGDTLPYDTANALSLVNEVLSGGGGQPLDTDTRSFMEPRFEHDFSRVRVYTDERAVESAHRVNALAYTLGQNVVFGEGKYAPGTSEGKKLIAHELTHTIQQEVAGTFSQTVQKEPMLAVHGTIVQRQPDDSPDTSVPAQDTSAAPSVADPSQQYQDALQLAHQTGDWRNAAELLNAFNHEDIQLRLAQLTVDEIGYLHQGALDNLRVGPQSQVALLTEPGTPPASTALPLATQVPPVSIPGTPSSGVVEQNAQISTGRRLLTDAQPWQDLQILPAVEDELPRDTFAQSESAITNGIYRLYPQIRNHDDPHVVFYIAYNTKAGRSEYAVGPDYLDTFIDSNFLLMVAAGNFFGLTGQVKPYEVSSYQVGALALRGDLQGAIQALGRSWVQALQDPNWWMQTILATSGALVAKGGINNVAGELAEGDLAGSEVGATDPSILSTSSIPEEEITSATSETDIKLLVKEGKVHPTKLEGLARKLARESWEKGSGNQLVKVISAERESTATITGYVTELKFVEGRTPSELEKILGLPEGELDKGAIIKRLDQLPNEKQFDLRGYTHRPEGRAYVTGAKYPPGLGAPQWKITEPIAATTIGEVKHGEVFHSTLP
jgi:Domain of unknown function (DUF4157)